MKRRIQIYLLVFALALIGLWGKPWVNEASTPEAAVVPLGTKFSPTLRPFAHLLDTPQNFPGVGGVHAKNCGKCHEKIYEEWQQSTHASAISDLQFLAELTKPDNPKWMCLNCHIPLQNQRPYKVTGFVGEDILKPITVNNPDFDPSLQKEAITCASCHIRRHEGKFVVVGPYGTGLAPHPVKKDKEALNEICQRCHNPRGEGLTPNLVCWFNTTEEMAEYNKKTGEEATCVSCHMKKVQRPLVAKRFKTPERKVMSHLWAGGGIPKSFDGYHTLLARNYKPGATIEPNYPSKVSPNKIFQVSLDITNQHAGHYLPTADPERYLKISIKLVDDEKVIHSKALRIGQIWKWSPARKVGDNRLKPKETRRWSVDVPAQKSLSNLRIIVEGSMHKVTEGSIEHFKKADASVIKTVPASQEKLREFEQHYPISTTFFRQTYGLADGQIVNTSLPSLLQENHKK